MLEAERYNLDLFKLLDAIKVHDKILFDEIINIVKAFGIKSNRLRALSRQSVIVDTGVNSNYNTTIIDNKDKGINKNENIEDGEYNLNRMC